MKLLSILIAASLYAQNSVTTTEYFTNTPLGGAVPTIQQFWFGKGEFAANSFPEINVGGTTTPTQVKVTKRHVDGSIKSAILAFVLPSPNVTFTFSSQATCNCSEAGLTGLTKDEILAGDFDFTATISPPTNTTGLSNQVVSARAILNATSANPTVDTELNRALNWQSSFIWMDGPIVTTWIFQDFTASESFNFGYKLPSDNPLLAIGDCLGQTTISSSQTAFCSAGASTLKAGDYTATVYNSAEVMRVFSVVGNTVRTGLVSESVAGRKLSLTNNDGAPIASTRLMSWNWQDPQGTLDKRAYPQIRCEFWRNFPTSGSYRYRCGFGASNHSTTKAAGPVVFGLTLYLGTTNPTSVYTYDAGATSFSRYNMWLSPGKQFFVDTTDVSSISTIPLEFWGSSNGNTSYQRAKLNIAYPWQHWVKNKLIPPYDTALSVTQADNTAKLGVSGTMNYPKTENNLPERTMPLGQGAMAAGWANTGGRPELGVFAEWNTDTLTTSGGDWRMQHLTMRHAYAHWGFFPIFYSETDGARTFNRGVAPVGRPWSTRSRAQIYVAVTWPNSIDRPPVAIPQASYGYNYGWRLGASVDLPHSHDPLTVAYMISGDFPILWRMWMAAGYFTFTGSTASAHRVDGATGKVSVPFYDQVRAHGRDSQYIVNAATFSPDGFHETVWLQDVKDEWTAATCGWHQVTACSSWSNSTPSATGPTFGTIWNFGDAHRKSATIGGQHRRPWGTNPLEGEGVNAFSNGASVLSQTAGILTVNSSMYVEQTWMANINRIAWGICSLYGNSDCAKIVAKQSETWCGALPQTLPDHLLCSAYWLPTVKIAAVTADSSLNRILHTGHPLINGQFIGLTRNAVTSGVTLPGGISEADTTTTQYRVCNATANNYQVCQSNGSTVVTLTTNGTGTFYVAWEARDTNEVKSMYVPAYLAKIDYTEGGYGSRTSWNDGYANRAMSAYVLACIANPTSVSCQQSARARQAFGCYQGGLTSLIPGLVSSSYNARGAWAAGTAYTTMDSVTNSGATWVAITASTGVTPGTDATKWQHACYSRVPEGTHNLNYAIPPPLAYPPTNLQISVQ